MPFVKPAGASDVWFDRVATRGRRVWVMGVGGSLIERWNGEAWRIVPSPPLQSDDLLMGIGLIGRRGALVVGRRSEGPLVFRWNGTGWSRVPVPAPPVDEFEHSLLLDVMVNSRNDIWLSGTIPDDSGTTRGLFEHWDGVAWQIAPTTVGGVYYLPASSPAADIWAVGADGKETYFASIAHWDGTAWSGYPTPDYADSRGSSLSGVAVVADDDVWGVGRGTTLGTNVPLAEHWDGSTWRLVATPTCSPRPISPMWPHRGRTGCGRSAGSVTGRWSSAGTAMPGT